MAEVGYCNLSFAVKLHQSFTGNLEWVGMRSKVSAMDMRLQVGVPWCANMFDKSLTVKWLYIAIHYDTLLKYPKNPLPVRWKPERVGWDQDGTIVGLPSRAKTVLEIRPGARLSSSAAQHVSSILNEPRWTKPIQAQTSLNPRYVINFHHISTSLPRI